MGTQSKKKKRTKDSRNIVADINRTQDLDANRLALIPTIELGYSPAGVSMIDWINVTDTINPAQG